MIEINIKRQYLENDMKQKSDLNQQILIADDVTGSTEAIDQLEILRYFVNKRYRLRSPDQILRDKQLENRHVPYEHRLGVLAANNVFIATLTYFYID